MLVNSNQNWFVRFIAKTFWHIIPNIFACVKSLSKHQKHFKVATKAGIGVRAEISVRSGIRAGIRVRAGIATLHATINVGNGSLVYTRN